MNWSLHKLPMPPTRWLKIAVLTTIAIITIVAVVLHARSDRLQTNPLMGAAVETQSLLVQTKRLKEFFETNDSLNANRYISIMQHLQKSCSRIDQYYEKSNNYHSQPQAHELISQGRSLCKDLYRLANYSESSFSAVAPLISSNSTLKRYQKLWPMDAFIRHRQLAQVNKALKTTKIISAPGNFSSQATTQLKDLRTAILSSRGIDYFPALRNFQIRMSGEYTMFWLNYVALDSLTRALKTQLNNYCQSQGFSTNKRVCHERS